MATTTIDSTHPSATINLPVLLASIDKMLTAARTHAPYVFSPDDYTLLWYVKYGNADGKTDTVSTSTISGIVVTYA